MAGLCTVRFLSTVRAVAARCKPPFALRRGLSQEEVIRTKGITKEVSRAGVKNKRDQQKKAHPVFYSSSPAGAMKEGMGRNSGSSSPAPSSTASALLSSPRSQRPRGSH